MKQSPVLDADDVAHGELVGEAEHERGQILGARADTHPDAPFQALGFRRNVRLNVIVEDVVIAPVVFVE